MKCILIGASLWAGIVMAGNIDPKATLATIEKAIKDGELGENLAKRAQNTENIYVTEIKNPGVDYRFFTFSDYKAGYTIMIDKGQLVILCKAFGGGIARNFKIDNKSGHKVLHFEYDSGSGITRRQKAKYNLGSRRSLVSDEN